jgi:hypothetical protein
MFNGKKLKSLVSEFYRTNNNKKWKQYLKLNNDIFQSELFRFVMKILISKNRTVIKHVDFEKKQCFLYKKTDQI